MLSSAGLELAGTQQFLLGSRSLTLGGSIALTCRFSICTLRICALTRAVECLLAEPVSCRSMKLPAATGSQIAYPLHRVMRSAKSGP